MWFNLTLKKEAKFYSLAMPKSSQINFKSKYFTEEGNLIEDIKELTFFKFSLFV